MTDTCTVGAATTIPSSTALPTLPSSLTALEAAFDTEYERLQELGRRTIEKAHHVGRLLAAVKSEVGHGGWGAGLKQRGVAERTASRLMRLATLEIGQIGRFGTVTQALESLANGVPVPLMVRVVTREIPSEKIAVRVVEGGVKPITAPMAEILPPDTDAEIKRAHRAGEAAARRQTNAREAADSEWREISEHVQSYNEELQIANAALNARIAELQDDDDAGDAYEGALAECLRCSERHVANLDKEREANSTLRRELEAARSEAAHWRVTAVKLEEALRDRD